MFSICIISDDSENNLLIEDKLNDFFFNQNISLEMDFLNATSLMNPNIWKDCNYDLAILDISNTKVCNKLMAYSIEIRTVSQKTKVIFISDNLSCALDTFDYNPDYFIYKPQIEKRLISAMGHLFEFEEELKGNSLVVNNRAVKYVIPEKKILYFEHYQHSTKIICEDRVVCCSEKLDNLQERLTDTAFVRCHCSFIVNLRQVREFSRTQLTLTDGTIVPCSRANQKNVRTAFEDIRTCVH